MTSISRYRIGCFFSVVLISCGTIAGAASGAAAEVRLGNNVHIGGHDFSHQSFDSKHRAVIYLYDKTPRKEGCVWRSDGHGGHVKTCHLRRIK